MIVLVIGNYRTKLGGAHSAFQNNIDILKRGGLNVESFSYDSDVYEYYKQRLGFVFVAINLLLRPVFYIFNPFVYARLRAVIRKIKPDVAHIHLYVGVLSNSAITALSRHKIPVVHTVHDYRGVCPTNAMLDPDGRLCDACFKKPLTVVQKRCAKHSVAISFLVYIEATVRTRIFRYHRSIRSWIFVSEFARSQFERRFPNELRRTYVLCNFIPDTLVKQNALQLSKQAERTGVVYAGRLSKEKGILEIAQHLSESKSKIVLKILGDGPLRAEIERLALRDPRIQYKGAVTRSEVVEELGSAAYSVVPSRWYENNPLGVIDSYCAGTPVIAADIGGLPEMVQSARNGFLFDSFSKSSFLQILDSLPPMNSKTYQSMQRMCVSEIETKYSERLQLQQLLTIYRDSLEFHG